MHEKSTAPPNRPVCSFPLARVEVQTRDTHTDAPRCIEASVVDWLSRCTIVAQPTRNGSSGVSGSTEKQHGQRVSEAWRLARHDV